MNLALPAAFPESVTVEGDRYVAVFPSPDKVKEKVTDVLVIELLVTL